MGVLVSQDVNLYVDDEPMLKALFSVGKQAT